MEKLKRRIQKAKGRWRGKREGRRRRSARSWRAIQQGTVHKNCKCVLTVKILSAIFLCNKCNSQKLENHVMQIAIAWFTLLSERIILLFDLIKLIKHSTEQ